MTDSDLVPFALETFALVVGAKLRVVQGGAGSGLEEGGTEHLDAALAHFSVPFPLAALAQARIIAHKSLEPSSDFAIAAGVQDLVRQARQDFGDVNGSEAWKGFEQGPGLLIQSGGSKVCDLLVQGA